MATPETPPPASNDPRVATSAHLVTLSLLGDTFATHEVGEEVAYSELLPYLVKRGEGKARAKLLLMVSAREFIDRFGFAPGCALEDCPVETLAPAIGSALDVIQETLSDEKIGWKDCVYSAGTLEREGAEPIQDGELRILISPAGGMFTKRCGERADLRGASHALSNALAPEGLPVPDEEVASLLIDRSQSGDLMATCGLAAYLQRNPGVVSSLSADTLGQMAAGFPDVLVGGAAS